MGIVLLALYALVMLYAVSRARSDSAGAFYVNSRSSSAWGVAVSMGVSSVGASATLGVAGMAFSVGMPAFWWLGAGAVGLALLSLLLAGKVRRSNAYTLPELVEGLLGAKARSLVSVIIVIAWTAILAGQFAALALVLSSLTGLGQHWSLGLGFLFIALHSMGGQSAVMRLDRVQIYFIMIILAILLVWLARVNPEWPGSVRFELVNREFSPQDLLYLMVVVGANYLICPMLFGRVLSAKDARSARNGGLLGAAGLLVCGLLIAGLGLACRGLVPPGTPPDAVLTAAVESALPAWLHLLASIAWVSAIVSSADSCLVTAATVLSHDLIKSGRLMTGRLCVLVLGLAGLGLSLWGKSILGFLLMAYGIFGSGVVAPVFVALMLQNKRRIDPLYGCAAICMGGVLGVAAALSDISGLNYAGILSAMLLSLAGARKESAERNLMPERV